MTYQERLDDYIRYEAWVHMQTLCRELIAELRDANELEKGRHAELARLRKREEVVNDWLSLPFESEDDIGVGWKRAQVYLNKKLNHLAALDDPKKAAEEYDRSKE